MRCWPGQPRSWLLVLLATFVFNFALIYRGVSKGIEIVLQGRHADHDRPGAHRADPRA